MLSLKASSAAMSVPAIRVEQQLQREGRQGEGAARSVHRSRRASAAW